MGWFLLHGNMNQPNTLMGDSLEAGKAAWGVWVSRSTLLDASSRGGGQWQAICLQHRGHGFDPWWGRAPGKPNGSPLHYCCLENPPDRGAWWATAHGAAKNLTWLSDYINSVPMSSLASQLLPPLLPSGSHKLDFYISDSTFVLYISLSIQFFYIPHICDVIWYFSFSGLVHLVWQSLGPILVFYISTSICIS